MGNQQPIGGCTRRRCVARYREERTQVNLLQLVEGFANGGNLFRIRAIRTSFTRKMLGDHQHLILTAGMQACDIGTSHLADPIRVAAKNA